MMFDITVARNLVSSTDEFAVDFNLVWEWLGYSRKDSAKRKFESSGFVEGQDFQVSHTKVENPEGGRPEEKMYLTVDCVKSFCMMANTEQGKQVRQYFIEAEKELRQLKQPVPAPQLPAHEIAEKTLGVVNQALSVLDRLGINWDEQPRMKQYYAYVTQHLVATSTGLQALPSGVVMRGVTEIAQEMGFPVSNKNWGQLGKYVRAHSGIEPQSEQRLVNGRMTSVNLYPDTSNSEKPSRLSSGNQNENTLLTSIRRVY